MTEKLPAFATNRRDTGETVAAEVNRLFRIVREHYTTKPDGAIATAYINPGGFALIANELEQVPRIRLLLGAEPDQETVRHRQDDEELAAERRLEEALDTHARWLLAERDAMGFDRDTSTAAKRMVAWLQSIDDEGLAKVEVRRYTEGFLHGKAYIADHPALPGVIAGSSNFTFAGLSRNAELNLGYPSGDHTDRVIDWFEHYWQRSSAYNLADLYSRQWEAHAPWTVYLRMLLELYGDHLDDERVAPTGLKLTPFQADGVRRMQRLIDSLGGVLVADEVGLGKTYLAGEVIRRTTDELRQRVLVIAPAALKESVWKPFIEQVRLTKVMSYEEVRNRVTAEDHDFLGEIEDTAMIVIDEAHNLRNAGAARSAAIDRVILAGNRPKKVVLLTATPVNNSLTDLETLVRYFVRDDAHFASIGIPSIREYIKAAQKLDPDALTPEHLFGLMDQIAVRRTRRFVKAHYPGSRIAGPGGTEVPVRFPRADAHRIDYTPTELGVELIDRMVEALDRPGDSDLFVPAGEELDPRRLTMARYTASGYLLGQSRPEGFQISNAGLLRSALLKRLESSPQALESTLGTLAGAHRTFLNGLANGYVLTGEALREAGGVSESDDLDAFVAQLDERFDGQWQPADQYDAARLQQAVESDLRLLVELRALATRSIAEEDTKAKRLIEELERIALDARAIDPSGLGVPSGDRRKTLVFSTYSDTIRALHATVTAAIDVAPAGSPLTDFRGRVPEPTMGAYRTTLERGATGSVDQGGRRETIEGFAPKTAGRLHDDGTPFAEDRYDLLFTTDVLAEGVNLQQAGRIVNYDLPWNPMRIVQRHGRVDRIGSPHETVQLGLFFPSERLDVMLRLEATLERKLAQADAAVGAGEVLPGRRGSGPLDFADQRVAEIEDLLEGAGSSAALSGEEYRRRLFKALEGDHRLRDSVDALPFGSGTGFVHPRLRTNGYVFCVRIGDQPTPWFRWIECDDEWRPTGLKPSDDTLASLIAADPGGPGTTRLLGDDAYNRAFDAWIVVRDDVHAAWTRLTDPSNLEPELPAASRNARLLVQRHGRFLPPEERGELDARLRTVPTAKVQAAIRDVLRSEADDEDRVRALQRVVAETGLQVPRPVKPLPPVSQAQVRVVCWMAVTGQRSGTDAHPHPFGSVQTRRPPAQR